ncbi:hypothetical protein [Oceanobacillus oncorhynchi]|uniref:hypothetical protein n=1 Tax=Oceanobacillus oncorhynchi TaxID=545501 RepID=UPI0025A32FC5|nr:hypothetical protein [Oceanobacillus oncorhynchi]MDM8100950.1 hypothetical protein [Oceanobacillus oncorhynchi]
MHLTEKQLKLITEVASQEAVKAFKADLEKQEEVKHDRRLHNIKLLLKNYRSLVLHCEDTREELEELQETSIQDLDVEQINLESIESIKRSKKKSLAMVYFIQGKMEAYKRACDSKEIRYYRVLEKKYITSRKYTIDEIAAVEHIDRATVHRYLHKAVEQLPVIFFGIDAVPLKKELQ